MNQNLYGWRYWFGAMIVVLFLTSDRLRSKPILSFILARRRATDCRAGDVASAHHLPRHVDQTNAA
jgi:hypothetical protein